MLTVAKQNSSALPTFLTAIAKQVDRIICFGGNNYHSTQKLGLLLNEMIATATKPFALYDASLTLPPSMPPDVQKKYRESLNTLLSNPAFTCGIPYNKKDDYFRLTAEGTLINPKAVKTVVNGILTLLEQSEGVETAETIPDYKLTIEGLKTFSIEDFKRIFAFLTQKWFMHVKAPNKTPEQAHMLLVGIEHCLKKKCEPTGPNRDRVIEYLAHDCQYSASMCGTGNCQLMAELAFLLAIIKAELPSPSLRYVQFVDTQNETEELNALVVGPWPNAGCHILAPWYSSEPFVWEGSFEKTEALQHYTEAKVLFSITNQRELKERKAQLTKLGIIEENLLDNPNRKNYLAYIDKISLETFNLLHPDVKLEKTVKKP